jgi:RNase P/RNase MRP subunit POP5
MKALMPTLRECKRYVGFEILSDGPVAFKVFEDAFEAKLKELIGTLGVAQAGAFVIKDSYNDNKGIIRVNNKFVDHIKAVFTMMKEVNGKSLVVKSIRTSGMINKVFEKELNKNTETK